MIKGGYQIIDFSDIEFLIYSEDQEVDITIENTEIYKRFTNTDKFIVISGLTITDEFEDYRKYKYHDFVPNTTYVNDAEYATITFDINVKCITPLGIDACRVTITPTQIKILNIF